MKIILSIIVAFIIAACSLAPASYYTLPMAVFNNDINRVDRMTRKNPEAINRGSGVPGGLDEVYPISYAIPFGGKGQDVEMFQFMYQRGANTRQVWRVGDPPWPRPWQTDMAGTWSELNDSYFRVSLSAMDIAGRRANREVMEILLRDGADPASSGALHRLVEGIAREEFGAGRNSVQEGNWQPSDGAAFLTHRLSTLRWMLDRGWSLEQRWRGQTPLMVAAAFDEGEMPMLLSLLEMGADIHSMTPEGFTVAAFAAANKSHRALLILLEHGLEINNAPMGASGEMILHAAARAKSPDSARIIQLLLREGADPNRLSHKHGHSPLMAAAVVGNYQAAHVLVAAGADINHRDITGRTAMDLSAANINTAKYDGGRPWGYASDQAYEDHEKYQAILGQAGGRYVMERPAVKPQVATKSTDRSMGAFFGGMAAAAVGHSIGLNESAAVDLGASMARDIKSGNVTVDNFEVSRFDSQNQNRAVAEVYMDHLQQPEGASTNRSSASTSAEYETTSKANFSASAPATQQVAQQSTSAQSGAMHGALIIPHRVSPESVRRVQSKGEWVTVSSDVPSIVYGTYHLPDQGGEASRVARRLRLNSDGTGELHQYGANQAPRAFEWGALVDGTEISITRTSSTPSCFLSNNECFEFAPSYLIIMSFPEGPGLIHVFEGAGRLAMPGPFNMAIEKE